MHVYVDMYICPIGGEPRCHVIRAARMAALFGFCCGAARPTFRGCRDSDSHDITGNGYIINTTNIPILLYNDSNNSNGSK